MADVSKLEEQANLLMNNVSGGSRMFSPEVVKIALSENVNCRIIFMC